MYKKIKEKFIKEINSLVTLYEHDKTKARVMTFDNDDTNKVFSIGFRTPAVNDTGLTHILEHSVLCGSKKYPVKDPFVELIKGSLNTFLNAMTYPDKTVYPVASMNDKDFQNLMDVYLDAVFNPNIYQHKEIFMQEGWHYHLENVNDDIEYNGVVYNEMKGALSSPDGLIYRNVFHSLFPDTTYHYESGGDPKNIPDLTYEEFLKFHSTYYHPSNSYIMLYGKMNFDEKMKYIEDNYLNCFDYKKVDTKVTYQKPFDKPVYEEYEYSVTDNNELENNSYLTYNVAYKNGFDSKKNIALDILTDVLVCDQGSPIKEAVIKSGITNEITAYYDSEVAQPVLSIRAKKVDKSKLNELKDLLEKELSNVKIDKEAIIAAINFREFKIREAKADGPKGLGYSLATYQTWLYDENKPFEAVEVLDSFKELRGLVDTNYFYDLVKEILESNHKSIVVLNPSVEIASKEAAELSAKLKAYKDSLTQKELEEIVKTTKALKEYQETPSTKEEIDTLPKLALEDLNPNPIDLKITKINDHTYYSDYFTNGIYYNYHKFDITDLTLQDKLYAKLLTRVFKNLSTENLFYGDIIKAITKSLGGFTISIDNTRTVKDEYKQFFTINYSCTDENLNIAYDLLIDILNNTVYDTNRLKDVMSNTKNMLESLIQRNGHMFAIYRSGSYANKFYKMMDETTGIGCYDFVSDLMNNWDDRKDDFVANLKRVSSIILNKSRYVFHHTADSNLSQRAIEVSEKFYNTLGNDNTRYTDNIELSVNNEGVIIPSKVNYVGKYMDIGYSPSGAIEVLRNIVSVDYLWQRVRVLNGAYGAMIRSNEFGEISLTSYRDPNVLKTLDIYNELGEYISNLDFNDEELLKFKIGSIKDDSYHNSSLGEMAFNNYIRNYTFEYRKQRRSEIINATLDEIKAFGKDIIEACKTHYGCTIGNENSINEAKDRFNNIRNLIK